MKGKTIFTTSRKMITGCNNHNFIVEMGDLNNTVGDDNTSSEEVIGKHGVGIINQHWAPE